MPHSLRRIRIQGLGSISDVTLEPGPLTVLVGPNGSGKSNVLRALRLAPRLRTQSLQRFVGQEAGGAESLMHYGPKHTQALSVELEFEQDDRVNRYCARLGFAAGDRLLFLDETVGFERRGKPGKEKSLGAGHWESRLSELKDEDTTARTVSFWLSRLSDFHFHDTSLRSQLRTNARAEDSAFLRSDGSNLASFLHALQQSEDEDDRVAWRRIQQLVRRIAPCVKTLDPTPIGSPADSVSLNWTDDRDTLFGVHHLSDGTLRAIALITALAQSTKRLPYFLSIDEPELGLHPHAIAIIAELARSVSRDCQVLFATQSTVFLDHFTADEVVVAERERGATKLTRHGSEELSSWLEDYSLSEVFEKGLIGGQP